MSGKLVTFAKTAKKKYGGVVGRADITPTNDRRLPTGSFSLDLALGGGYRVGWVTSLYGEKSGGKTTSAIRGLSIAQNFCRNCYRPVMDVQAVEPSKEDLNEDPDARWSATGTCDCYKAGLYVPEEPIREKEEKAADYRDRVEAWRKRLQKNSYEELVTSWVDPEGTFDKKYATDLGMDCRRVLYVRPESAEEGIDILHALVCTVEVDFLALDSIANLVPMSELSSSMVEWQQGLQARLMNKAIRKLISGSSMVARQHRAITQIWINQVRDKIGTVYGDPTVKPGGKGQEFAVCAEIKFGKSAVEYGESVYGSKEKKEVDRIPKRETFFFEVTKNKTAGTKKVTGRYTQLMRTTKEGKKGAVVELDDVYKRVMMSLVKLKKNSKGKYVLLNKEYSSQKAILDSLKDDPVFYEKVKKTLLDLMLEGVR